MNGLKFIRTRCNYSQKSLAETLGVSRQAVNMWENSKKDLSDERKKELCNIFGLDDTSLFEEISIETQLKIEAMPLYRVSYDDQRERFSFKAIESEEWKFKSSFNIKGTEDIITLDEQCALKRLELKRLYEDIENMIMIDDAKNSYSNLSSMNRILMILNDSVDLYKEALNKHPEYVMVYFKTIVAVLDAMSISFGLLEKNDIADQNEGDLYNYSDFSLKMSEFISKHLNDVCDLIPSKRNNPSLNYRRRKIVSNQ